MWSRLARAVRNSFRASSTLDASAPDDAGADADNDDVGAGVGAGADERIGETVMCGELLVFILAMGVDSKVRLWLEKGYGDAGVGDVGSFTGVFCMWGIGASL